MEQSKNWLEYFQPQNQVAELLDTNEETAHFGLTLTEKDAQMIVHYAIKIDLVMSYLSINSMRNMNMKW